MTIKYQFLLKTHQQYVHDSVIIIVIKSDIKIPYAWLENFTKCLLEMFRVKIITVQRKITIAIYLNAKGQIAHAAEKKTPCSQIYLLDHAQCFEKWFIVNINCSCYSVVSSVFWMHLYKPSIGWSRFLGNKNILYQYFFLAMSINPCIHGQISVSFPMKRP